MSMMLRLQMAEFNIQMWRPSAFARVRYGETDRSRFPLLVQECEHLIDVQPTRARVRSAWHLDVLVVHAKLFHLRDPLSCDVRIDRSVRIALNDHYRQFLSSGNRVW